VVLQNTEYKNEKKTYSNISGKKMKLEVIFQSVITRELSVF